MMRRTSEDGCAVVACRQCATCWRHANYIPLTPIIIVILIIVDACRWQGRWHGCERRQGVVLRADSAGKCESRHAVSFCVVGRGAVLRSLIPATAASPSLCAPRLWTCAALPGCRALPVVQRPSVHPGFAFHRSPVAHRLIARSSSCAAINTRCSCVTEEIFAPLAPVVRFTEEAEVLRIANSSTVGLAGKWHRFAYRWSCLCWQVSGTGLHIDGRACASGCGRV